MMSKWWVYLMFLLLLEPSDAHDSSDLILDFMSVFNGKWDNRARVQAGLTTSLIESRFVPVDIPALRPKTLMYFENALNGRVFSMYLCEVNRDKSNSNTVLLRPYNFTDASNYTAGEYDLEHLSNVTPADMTEFTRCTVKLQTSGNGEFFGLCPQCNHTLNEAHPACSMTFGCDHYDINRPPSAKEPTKPLHDVFQLNGSRYPLVNTPKDYVSPCDKRKRPSTNDTQT